MWLYLCYILTRTFILAEVITLIKNDNVTCVLTGDSVYSGLYISSFEDQKGFNRSQNQVNSWVNDDWLISNNTSQYHPITDIRWESLEISKSTFIGLENNSVLTFSVCHKNDLVFKLLDGNKDETSFKVKEHFCNWSHYALYIMLKTQVQSVTVSGSLGELLKKGQIEKLKKENEETKKDYQLWNLYDDKLIETVHFTPKWLRIGERETVKIVKHKYRYSNRTSENYSYLDIPRFSKHLCLSMFISVDIDCYLNVTLTSGNETVNQTVTGFNEENSLKEWKKIQIENNFGENAKLMFFRGHSSGRKEGYWAVDNIAFCRSSVETNNIHLPPSISYNSMCKVLNTNLTNTKICEKRGYIGNNCNISCSQVLGKSYPNCETYKICSENSNCSCAWGYGGEFCNKTCDSGHWGMNCSLNCGPNCETCDNMIGCTKCKKEFFQDYPDFLCDETLPVLMRPPVLTSITEHSLTVLVDMIYDQTAKKPEYYQIQYKNSNQKMFHNYSQPKHFNNGGNVTETISNLSTTKLEHQIRIILIVQNQSFTDKVNTLTSRKTLEATINNNNQIINLSWNSPTWENAVTYDIEHECFKDFCGEYTNAITSTKETNLMIDALQNSTTCHIQLFSINTKNSKQLIDEISVISPNSSSDINATVELPKKISLLEDSVNIELESCEGFNGQLNYNLTYQCVSQWCNNKIQFTEIVLTKHENLFNKKIQGLKPFSEYRINVTAKRGSNTESKPYGPMRTPPGKPLAIRNLSVFCKNESALWIKWQAPYPPTGNVSFYNITLKDGETTQNSSSNSPCELWDDFTCATFTELKKKTNYTIIVQAKNEGVQEGGTEVNVTTQTIQEDCEAPPNLKINLSTKPKEIILSWDHPLIMNGPLEKFGIEINEKIMSAYNITEKKYQRTYNYKIPVEEENVYRISVWGINKFDGERAKINATTYSLFVSYSSIPIVGWCSSLKCFLLIPKPDKSNGNFSALLVKNDEKYTEEKIKNTYRSLLNNSEQNESKWIVKMSSFQNDSLELELGDMFNKSISVKNRTHLLYVIHNDDDGLTVYESNQRMHISNAELRFIAVIIGIIIVTITILIWGFLCYARKYNKFPFKTGEQHVNSATIFEFTPNRNIRREPTLLNNNTEIYEPIKINDLELYLSSCLEDESEDNQLTQQFEVISKQSLKKCDHGRLPENIQKNRYTNVIAYDETRVVLKDNEYGDYINANYVNGYNIPRAFIATQTPLPHTVNDFWSMIWQENIKTVVMLTNLNENRTIVCEKYWPKFGLKCRFGNIVILNVSSKMFPSYVKREFQVKYQNKTHRVQQFQYIKWPDHGVPTNLQEFTPFMKVISGISKHTSPILVHCNTGCGRTGTVILCDIVLKMAQYKKQVNFAEVLKQLRNQRPWLVSTVDHYVFAHRVVVEYFRQKKKP